MDERDEETCFGGCDVKNYVRHTQERHERGRQKTNGKITAEIDGKEDSHVRDGQKTGMTV